MYRSIIIVNVVYHGIRSFTCHHDCIMIQHASYHLTCRNSRLSNISKIMNALYQTIYEGSISIYKINNWAFLLLTSSTRLTHVCFMYAY